jgi:DNA-binding GntR family transcriptional regulator
MIESMIRLDKRKNMPLNEQLLLNLRSILLNRNLRNTTELPQPEALAHALNMDAASVINVYETLIQQAVIEQGGGVYRLKSQVVDTYHRVLSGIIDAIESYGMKAKVDFLVQRTFKAHEGENWLKLSPRSSVYEVERIFRANDLAVAHEHVQFSMDTFPNLDQILNNQLRLYQSIFKTYPASYRITRRIRAEGLPKDIAEKLKQPPKIPAYHIIETLHNDLGQQVEEAHNWVIADYFHFFAFDVDLKTRA